MNIIATTTASPSRAVQCRRAPTATVYVLYTAGALLFKCVIISVFSSSLSNTSMVVLNVIGHTALD